MCYYVSVIMSTNQINKLEFLGNQRVIDFFNNSFERGFSTQAFGLYGIKHLGKKYLVNLIAQKNECLEGINFFKVKSQEDKRDISIEQIRNWQKMLRLQSVGNRMVIGVIESAEDLSLPASNALLKIIEEPPKNTLLFLTVSNSNSILKTLQSRLLAINFNKTTNGQLLEDLLSLGYDKTKVNTVVDVVNGLPGLAIKLLNNEQLLDSWQKEYNEVEKMINSPLSQRLVWLHKIFEDKKNNNLDAISLLTKVASVVSRQAKTNPTKYAPALSWLVESPRFLSSNVNQRLLFERIILSL